MAAVLALLAAIVPGRFGGGGAAAAKEEGPLRWQVPARTSAIAGATGGHLLFGRVVNHSNRPIRLRAADVHLIGRDGHRLRTRAAFADGFVPSVQLGGYDDDTYGAAGAGSVGGQVVLKTGQAAPLSASFTAGAGERAVAIEYAGGRLKLE
jgi:hypothetical protein